MERFDHEKLTVYHIAIEFLSVADNVVGTFPTGRAYLADQLHRAATSIVLNIAEGAGEFSKKEKARFYRMALRSATECAAIVDVCRHLRLVPEKELLVGREMMLRIVSMLVRLVRSVGKGEHGNSSGTGTGTGTGWGSGKTGGTR